MRGYLISPQFQKMNSFTILRYSSISIIRSNRFFAAFVFSRLAQGLLYFSFPVFYILLANKVQHHFILIAIAVTDAAMKYYSPGQFTEYVYVLLKLTLRKKEIATFITLNIIFYYCNLAILPSIVLGISINGLFSIWSILILNHLLIFLLKLLHKLDVRSFVFCILLSSLLVITIMQLLNAAIISLVLLIAIVIFFPKYLQHSLYVK